MDLFLAHFGDSLDQDAHAVMMCDGAGWHDERALTVRRAPSPWRCCRLTVRDSTPSSGFGSTYANASYRSASLDDTEAIIDACCQAWIDLIDQNWIVCEPSASYPRLMKVIS